ncbi:MAG: hypothetical protein ACYTBX_07385 [Planctomycetota bacterium]|jgi:hypothetical protein
MNWMDEEEGKRPEIHEAMEMQLIQLKNLEALKRKVADINPPPASPCSTCPRQRQAGGLSAVMLTNR